MSSSDSTTSNKSSSNFISKNINHFNTERSTKHPSPFTVSGVAVALTSKVKLSQLSKNSQVTKERRNPTPRESIPSAPQPSKKRKKQQPPLEIRKIVTTKRKHSVPFVNLGIRRTSIRAKTAQALDFVFQTEEKAVKKEKKREGSNKREVLSLPVSWIAVPQPEPIADDIEILIKLFGRKLKEKGQREAVQRRVEGIDRLRNRMEDVQSKDTHRDGNTRLPHISAEERQEPSYEDVYQRHVDELASVISQAKLDEQPGKKAKRKNHPKLEIKIVPAQISVTEPAEHNCGDITPVITYNHVTSDSAQLEQGGAAVSPGSSRKGSRSPSPLLEVPSTPGELCTKFPTQFIPTLN